MFFFLKTLGNKTIIKDIMNRNQNQIMDGPCPSYYSGAGGMLLRNSKAIAVFNRC